MATQRQQNSYFCGPAAISNLLSCYSKVVISQSEVARLASTTENGTSAKGIKKAFKALGHRVTSSRPYECTSTSPFILYIKETDHWVAVIPVDGNKYRVLDSNKKVVTSKPMSWKDLGKNVSRRDAYAIYVNIDLPLLKI
jgi:ABC-type bacteriocin/lantibiotic exporter with double-glycine peptidase domain